ncbi:hypothetical protein RN001_014894 [Aquatica leii]|uniref:Uncharacterized protein n=1 Tax=Aquatica leii TaxID=1421715 RepID=A0AAN7SNB2_9COLE|nr:hypothetical protein RN001_014894 [Aquatica leii]
MPIDFYYAQGSGPCRFLQVLAKHLDIEFNSIHLDLMTKKEHLTPEFIKINPQHCVPTIVDDGFALWESNAIATYLIQKYGKDDSLLPKEPKKRAVVDQRLYFNNGVLSQRFGDYYYPLMLGTGVPDPEKYKKIEEGFEFLETFLDKHEYVAGDCMTVADLAISTTVSTFDVAKFDRSAYKNVAKWYKKIQASVPSFEEFNGVEMLTKLYEKYLKK